MQNKYQCVIFDFDGTLADTNTGIVQTYQATFRHMGLPEHSAAEISATIGLPLRDIIAQLQPSLDSGQLDYACKYYRDVFNSIALPSISLFPGVLQTLKSLKDKGAKLAVASSRGGESLRFLISHLGLDGLFDMICCEESVSHPKPAPDMVLLILRELGMSAEDTLMVGDTTFDLQMGASANCHTLGVCCGNHSAEQLQSVSPDAIRESIGAAADFLFNENC